MSTIFFQLGHNPELASQEISQVFTTPVQRYKNFCTANIPKSRVRAKFAELGGSIRAMEYKGEGENYFNGLEYITKDIQKNRTEGKKMRVGIFFHPPFLKDKFFPLQKKIKNFTKGNSPQAEGKKISLRIVNRGNQTLDAASVQKEKLLQKGNAEYGIVKHDEKFVVLKTIAVQDIHPFIKRDTKKPVRDMQVGMLPPKLARTMINMSRDAEGNLPEKIYDPFCGTGTVLLEALDLELKIAGSDISRKEIESTKKNCLWMHTQNSKDDADDFAQENGPYFLRDIFVKDAAEPFKDNELKKIKNSAVVAEGFLGKIFHKPITEDQFWSQKDELYPLYRKFLFAVSQTKIEKIVFAFPFWRGEKKRYSFTKKLVEFTEKLGYKTLQNISYIRENQVVGREIIVFEFEKK